MAKGDRLLYPHLELVCFSFSVFFPIKRALYWGGGCFGWYKTPDLWLGIASKQPHFLAATPTQFLARTALEVTWRWEKLILNQDMRCAFSIAVYDIFARLKETNKSPLNIFLWTLLRMCVLFSILFGGPSLFKDHCKYSSPQKEIFLSFYLAKVS